MYKEKKIRSVVKAFSWRFCGTLATTGLVFLFTRRWDAALGVGSADVLSKMFLFFIHERIWNRLHFGKYQVEPTVIWLTGLSGSGKSTLGRSIHTQLLGNGFRAEYLDGDTIRDIFPATGFTRVERDNHIKRVGYLASRLESNGVFVVASFVSPYEDAREFVRKLCKRFVLVHVSTPIEECERRDIKGLYAKARRGEIKGFTGIDDPYEIPQKFELKIDTTNLPIEEATNQVMNFLRPLI
jgi:adenylylsulfate kinase